MSGNLIAEDEVVTIKKHILLSNMLTMCTTEYKKLEESKSSFKQMYLQNMDVLMNRIHVDLVAGKKFLASRKVKIILDEENSLRVDYIYRGYENEMELLRYYAKAEISVMLGEYMAGVVKDK